MRALAFPLAIAFLLGACSAPSSSTSSSGSANSAPTCSDGSPLSGTSYDVGKSRFAFGSTPVAEDAGSLVRWVGADGVVAIFSDGSEMGILNASAPESGLPDWSTDPSKLAAHASDYWVSMGVAPCQIASTGVDGSASGGGAIDGGSTMTRGPSTIVLGRGIDGIRVVESIAAARFDVNDETTSEAFYWPEIPADVVTAAVALNKQLSDPAALAAFKAKLPADAQGDGVVVIHHSHAGATPPFQAAATYEVQQTTSGAFLGELLDFDPNGNPVPNTW